MLKGFSKSSGGVRGVRRCRGVLEAIKDFGGGGNFAEVWRCWRSSEGAEDLLEMLEDIWRCLRDFEGDFRGVGGVWRVLEGFGKIQWGFRDIREIWGRLERFCRCSRGFEGLGGVLEIERF